MDEFADVKARIDGALNKEAERLVQTLFYYARQPRLWSNLAFHRRR